MKQELEVLLSIATALASTTSRQEVLQLLVRAIGEVLDVVRCSVIVVDEEGSIGRVVASHEKPLQEEIRIQLEKYPEIEESLRTGDLVFVHDVRTDPLMQPAIPHLKNLDIRSIVVVPMAYQEQILGTLLLRTSRARRVFDQHELTFCQVASRMAANALLGLSRYQRATREKEYLAEQAGRDALTRLYNQESLYRRLEEELAAAKRYERPLSYLTLEIDHFKEVSNFLGRQRSDELLKAVARTIRQAIRKVDVVGRYGGNEFGIILQETGATGAIAQADRIREAIRQMRVKTPERSISVSASVGVSTFPCEGVNSAVDLIRPAHEALRLAKSQGKDRTTSFATAIKAA